MRKVTKLAFSSSEMLHNYISGPTQKFQFQDVLGDGVFNADGMSIVQFAMLYLLNIFQQVTCGSQYILTASLFLL